MEGKGWGIDVVPKEKWIDPEKKYTSNGKRVINIRIVLYNSAGREVTYPVQGTVVLREKPFKTNFSVWTLDGIDNVVWPNNKFNLEEVK